jgi:hypothetical protein
MEIFSNLRDAGLMFTEKTHYGEELLRLLGDRLDENYILYSMHGGAPYSVSFPKFGDRIKIMLHTDNEVFFDDRHYDSFDFVFRLYLHDRCDHQRVFPIPTGLQTSNRSHYNPGPNIPLQQRQHDVFFQGQKWNREDFRRAAEQLKWPSTLIEFTDGFRGGSDFDTYNARLDQSKIVLAPGGLSPETFRYNEAFARGCCVITDQPSGQWWHEGSPAVFIKDWKDLNGVIENLLDSISSQTHVDNRRYFEEKLSPLAVADYIAGIVTNKRPLISIAKSWLTIDCLAEA